MVLNILSPDSLQIHICWPVSCIWFSRSSSKNLCVFEREVLEAQVLLTYHNIEALQDKQTCKLETY